MMAGSVVLACANSGASVAWVVPTYKNARPLWRFAERMTHPVARHLNINKSERVIEFPSGGWFGIYTADSPVSILGEAFDLVICEEAARIPPSVWEETILPTLADRAGKAMLISTPKGKNWFWNEFQRGLSDGSYQASFTAPSSANPIPNIQKAFELARQKVSYRTFRQEWLAEFIDDGGEVFRNVRPLSTLKPTGPRIGARYVIGVDWGRTNDPTVFSIWDCETRQEVKLDRMQDTPYSLQIARLLAHHKTYNNAHVIAESNGVGDPLVEQTQAAGIPVTPFVTSNVTKAQAVDEFELALEQSRVQMQDDDVGISEMESFKSSRTATNLVKYSAPEGLHDDIPMARVIAWQGIQTGEPAGELAYADDYRFSQSDY